MNSLIIVFTLLLSANLSFAQMHFDWVKRYSGPGSYEDVAFSLSVDDSGNVYVTGGSQNGPGYDCVTIKYNKFGDSLWTRVYISPVEDFNLGENLKIDDSSNVYVASSNAILKYHTGGNLIWVTQFDSTHYLEVEIDSLKNVYAAGVSFGQFVASKFDRNGNGIWRKKYGNAKAFDNRFQDMDIDNNGNFIITGSSKAPDSFIDYATLKYSNDGNLVWVRRYNGPAPPLSYDIPYAVTTDISGNVYVTGASMDSSGSFNCLTIKYDSSGNTIWVKRISEIASDGYDIEVDSSQNVFIAGSLGGRTSTIKLDSDGNIIWSRIFSQGDPFGSYPVIVTDSIYNVYVTATITSTGAADYAAIKYDSSGNQIYVVTYNNLNIGFDYPYSLAIDKSGNIYLTGKSNGSMSYYDYATVKFSPIMSGISNAIFNPVQFKLHQNYPNPFNPATNLGFGISKLGFVSLKVYDVLGNEVSVLVNEKKIPGDYEVEFNGSNFPSGIYFYRLEVDGSVIDTKKMLLLK